MSTENAERVHLFIRGRVQGVCYRACAKQEADALGLTGWVRNLPDHRVESVAEGPRETLQRYLEWCREGPSWGRVDGVEATWGPASGEFAAFRITG
jgi:acylphosphatase